MIEPAIRLRRAIYLKDVPLVRRILKANPGLLENPDYDDKSITSLHLAAEKGYLEITVRQSVVQHYSRLTKATGSATGRWP